MFFKMKLLIMGIRSNACVRFYQTRRHWKSKKGKSSVTIRNNKPTRLIRKKYLDVRREKHHELLHMAKTSINQKYMNSDSRNSQCFLFPLIDFVQYIICFMDYQLFVIVFRNLFFRLVSDSFWNLWTFNYVFDIP